jgi:alpha-ketoglutarate-dependent taurine dioxygenase
MTHQDDAASDRGALGPRLAGRRRAQPLSGGGAVRETHLASGQELPLVIEPAGGELDLAAWAASRREPISRLLLAHAALLFRGFHLDGPEALERCVRALSGDALDYTFRSTPRRAVEGKIFTSTEYPRDQAIPMHNEMSYTRTWPRKIWFYSRTVAASGGETPLADSRRVFAAIPPAVRERFARSGVMYVRNYGGGIDLPWQEVFQTADRGAVAAYCREHGIELEWRGSDELCTRQVCQATATHPETGEDLWFNQAHLFHVSSLDPELAAMLTAERGPGGLPRNAYYGDGAPIDDAALAAIRAAYDCHQVVFPWQQGDVLLLDNMLVAHGRRPYSGSRSVVVGMAEAWSTPN